MIVELNCERYLTVDVIVTSDNFDTVNSKIKKFKCIEQGVKELKKGFFSAHAVITLLVPEKNIIEFNKY